jgi:hypothetical protein
MKALLLTFLITIVAFGVNAQTITPDSAMVKRAKTDAVGFKLDRSTWHQFKAHNFAYSSDYFKPTALTTRDTFLLKDSSYIKTFKMAAYKKTLHRRTAGHHVLVIGSITLGVVIIVGFILLSSELSNQVL